MTARTTPPQIDPLGKPEIPELEATAPESNPLCGFLDLPCELRLQIYSYCIPQDFVVFLRETVFFSADERKRDFYQRLRDFPNQGRRNLFILCKQISNEALDILYATNTFEILLYDQGEKLLRYHFTDASRHRIQKVLVVARCSFASPWNEPDISLWASLLPNLRNFGLIASQGWYDTVGGLKWDGLGIHEAYMAYNTHWQWFMLERWLDWIENYLECFGQYLREETCIEVDFMDGQETKELIQRYMPSTWKPFDLERYLAMHVSALWFRHKFV